MHPFKTVQEQWMAVRRMNTECSSGQYCHFNNKVRCMFKHSPNQTSFPQERQGNQIETGQQSHTRPALWCSFQDRCNRRRTCPFRHYDGGVPEQADQGGLGVQPGQGDRVYQGALGVQRDQGDLAVQPGQGGRGGQDDQGAHGGKGGQLPQEWLPRLKCPKCDYETNSQYELLFHIESIHQHKKLKCDNCTNTFDTSETLVCHMIEVHTNAVRQNRDFMNASFQENF